MKKVLLVIERSAEKKVWGRVSYAGNLLVDSAASIGQLQKKMTKLLCNFHGLKAGSIDFDLAYDLSAVFKERSYLNLSGVAQKAGINRSLMAQYASGAKHPSIARAMLIQAVIHDMGRDLLKLRIAVKDRRVRSAGVTKKERQKV